MAAVYWIGADGNAYLKGPDGVVKYHGVSGASDAGFDGLTDGGAGQSVQAQRIDDPNPPRQIVSSGGSTGGSGEPDTSADDLAYLADQADQLRSLLGRTDTSLNHGLTKLGDDYNTEKDYQDRQEKQAIQGYADQRIDTNKGKLSAYDTINRNAGNGYRSLAQIIGRASGTGSSAFRDLLPDVIGKDTSSKRRTTTETFGRNLQGIDKAQSATELSFEDILKDLLKQRKSGEEDLRAQIEGQRQGINQQLATNAGQAAQVRGGGYASVHSAQAPYQAAIDQSRNQVESFFNQFRTPYKRTAAAVAAPELSQYNVDRSSVNAQNQGQSAENPYTSLLRKRIQESAA